MRCSGVDGAPNGDGASTADAAPGRTRPLLRRAVPEELVDDAVLLVSELVTNAVVYAGTDIDVVCRLERHPATRVGVVVEVADRHPSRGVRGGADTRRGEPGYGLQLVSALSESWGVTYRRAEKRVWFRLEAAEGDDCRDRFGRLPARYHRARQHRAPQRRTAP